MKNHIKLTLLLTTIVLGATSINGMQPAAVTADQQHLQTQLFEAARSGNHQKIASLVAAGAQVNLADKFGRTALILAAERGNLACVRLLIGAGAIA